jgi:Domain of unknown function (DUF4386)
MRKTALVAGLLYLLTFVSIPTLFLYDRVLHNPDYILSAGSVTGVRWGGVLELIVALAGIGTAVALFPVVRRYHEGLALGFVATRVVEGSMIVVGVVSLLSVVALRQDRGTAAGADAAALVSTGRALVALYNGTFLLGQTLMPALNALLLGSLLYRARLVPRVLPALGLIGAPLLLASVLATILGLKETVSTWSAILTLPVAAWEFSLGLWLIFKGFTAAASAPGPATVAPVAPQAAVAASRG